MLREARRTKSPPQSTYFARKEQGNTAKPHSNTQDFCRPVAGPQRNTFRQWAALPGPAESTNGLFANKKSAHPSANRSALWRHRQPAHKKRNGKRLPGAPRSRQAPTSEWSETEVEIRGRVPATTLAALAHPAARYAELGRADC